MVRGAQATRLASVVVAPHSASDGARNAPASRASTRCFPRVRYGHPPTGLAAAHNSRLVPERRFRRHPLPTCASHALAAMHEDLDGNQRPPRGIVLINAMRKLDPPQTAAERLERAFPVHLLSSRPIVSSATCVLRPGNVHGADGWEHTHAGHDPVARESPAYLFPRGCRASAIHDSRTGRRRARRRS